MRSQDIVSCPGQPGESGSPGRGGLHPSPNRARLSAAPMIEFRILGPLEVAGDEGLVGLGGQKQRALLGLLLVNAGQVVSTDRLIAELWGERPPRAAKASLHNLVGQLRTLLGQEVVVTRPPGYVLRA